MFFLDLIILWPELFLLNTILCFFWLALYLKVKFNTVLLKHWVGAFNHFSIFIFLCYMVLLVNTFSYETISFSGLLVTSHLDIFLKLAISIIFIGVLITILPSERVSQLSTILAVELTFIRLILVYSLILLIHSTNLIWLFFSLELYALSSYLLVAHKGRQSVFSGEVAIKYFIIGTVFSILSIYSIVLFYYTYGTLDYTSLNQLFFQFAIDPTFWTMTSGVLRDTHILKIAVIFLFSSLLFKISAAPFHFWAVDVYEGTPTSILVLLATVPKIAIFGVLIKLSFLWELVPPLFFGFVIVSSIVIGALGGIFQKRVKRLLAFSMINNTGFLLLGLLVGTTQGVVMLLFYLLVYVLTTLGLFASLLSLRSITTSKLVKNIWGWSNIFFFNKPLALSLSALLFSSAGIPPLVGFLTKFTVLFTTSEHTPFFYFLIVIVLILAPFSVFYYIRVLKIMAFVKKSVYTFYAPITTPVAFIISVSVVLMFVLFLNAGFLLSLLSSILL